jgi:apolipoprotein N-acyltransferase
VVIASLSGAAYNPGPMKARELLAACFLLFGALLLWPLLTIANRPVLIAGVPALALYLFAVWAAIVVVLIAVAVRRRALEDDE